MKPNAFAPRNSSAFSAKAILLFCVVCLSFFAGVVRADDDLSPADKVQAERLQNQIDAESKAAHDKAEQELYRQQHPGGGNVSGLIYPAILVCAVVGLGFYAKNKKAGKAFAAVSAVVIGGMVVCSLVDDYQWTHADTTPNNTANEVVSNYFVVAAQTEKAEAIKGLQNKLVQNRKDTMAISSDIEATKPLVTYYWKQYQAQPENSSAKFNYDEQLLRYKTQTENLVQLQQDSTNLEAQLAAIQSK